MKTTYSKAFLKSYSKLPKQIQKKTDKQIQFLVKDYHHPSLRTRKMSKDIFEGRIDYHYRFTFTIKNQSLFLLTVGLHDEGLGKK